LAKSVFGLAGGANFTTVGNFANAGALNIGKGSTFTVGGTGVFTQTAGTTTDSGTLVAAGGVTVSSGTLDASGNVSAPVLLSGGSLFSSGTITGNLTSSGIITPGTTATTPGTLTEVGSYTQNAAGSLDIDIAGTQAGKQYDVVASTSAVLGGTLNITTTKFTPTVGETFKILTYGSETGTFAKINGLTINSTEEYSVTYQPTDVLLTVVSIPGATASTQTPPVVAATDERARLGEALRAFNTDYAAGGRQTVATANNAALAKQRVAEHINTLAHLKAHR
jgi:hypothetical protein